MGITIIQKSDLRQKKHNSKIALVLSGGAVSGGAFKAGGLKAFNDFLVNRKVNDFDIYVGISAGGLLAVPLAGGLPPEEILKSLEGTSERFSQLSPLAMYFPNWKEMLSRPLDYLYRRGTYIPAVILDAIQAIPNISEELKKGFVTFAKRPNYSNYEKMIKPLANALYSSRNLPSLFSTLPSGIFDNRPIEKYLKENMRRNKMTNHFKVLKRLLGKELYICATELDSGDWSVFGWDERNDISISEAVMASTAMPGFYKPANIKGVDYIDGGVQKTANIDLAIQKGADLVICYNPFRPLKNKIRLTYNREKGAYITRDKRISGGGLFGVFNQVFRTLYHSRLSYAINRYAQDKNFKGDIILIEPTEDDESFFQMNPFAFWTRSYAAKSGFESVRLSIEKHFDQIKAILGSYGIEMSKDLVEQDEAELKAAEASGREVLEVLEKPGSKRNKGKLRLISA
ncbi:MAG: patatin-like phospholipase family protein [Deltaproteobacteria bacterium]|nr:patatin-like phospholipase family protein [Deltaproteobacteria bacterium]